MRLWREPVRVRWWIFWYLFAFALLAYMQRTSVAVAADSIMPALQLNQLQIGWLNAAFTAAYAFAQIPGGVLGLRLGARRIYVLAGILGLAAMLVTPLAPVIFTGTALFVVLVAAQATLGAAQGPIFPMFAAVAQNWFPVRQWCLINGLQSAGMNLGGAVTPLLIVALTQTSGWQGALLWLSLPVALVIAGWSWYGRDKPVQHRSVTPAELAELGPEASAPNPPLTMRRMGAVLGDRNVLLLSVSYLCMNYTFYLLSFWSFLYLVQVRHFSGMESGLVGAVPWIGAGIGAGVGGYLSDRCAERFGTRWGYRLLPLLTLPIAGILLIAVIQVETPYLAVAALAAAFAAIEINEGVYWAATMCVARTDTAAAAGVLNTGGNLGGIITQPLVGALATIGSWDAAFFTGTGFALVAAACWLLIDAERPVKVPGPIEGAAALVPG
jgi:ACS family glucarate transporter-like MFS transporter